MTQIPKSLVGAFLAQLADEIMKCMKSLHKVMNDFRGFSYLGPTTPIWSVKLEASLPRL